MRSKAKDLKFTESTNKKTRILLDSHSAHTSKETKAYLLTKENRFQLSFTPKHGSWLNLVETFFSKMTRSFLRGNRVSSKDELVPRIYTCIVIVRKFIIIAIIATVLVITASCGNTVVTREPTIESTSLPIISQEPVTVIPIIDDQVENLYDETLERYYDYVQDNPQIIALLHSLSAEKGFSDNEMAAFSLIAMNNLGYLDYTNGNSKEEFNRITEKYFDSKIENFNNTSSRFIPQTGMIISTGWSYDRAYMVLKDLIENTGDTKTATFYRLIQYTGDDWGDEDTVKSNLLSGNFNGYGEVYLVEMEFVEKYDENGDMYFKFISANLLSQAEEKAIPYGSSTDNSEVNVSGTIGIPELIDELGGFWHSEPNFSSGMHASYEFGSWYCYYTNDESKVYSGQWDINDQGVLELELEEDFEGERFKRSYSFEYIAEDTATGKPALIVDNQKFWKINKPQDVINGAALYINHDYNFVIKDYQTRKAIKHGQVNAYNAEHIVIYSEADLYNFKIYSIDYTDEYMDDFYFYYKEAIFSVDVLSSDYFMEYITSIPEGYPVEAITFNDNEGIAHSYVLTYNGRDGSTCATKEDKSIEDIPLDSDNANSILNNDEGIIYLDIDNDGIIEKTEYVERQNILRITKNAQLLVEVNLYDYGVTFNATGMHNVLYYYEYVSDSADKTFLHFYVSSFIGVGEDGKRYTSVFEDYYKLNDVQLNLADSVEYTMVKDYSESLPQKMAIHINGQKIDSLESIETKYTKIENTYYEIPY